MKYLLQMLLMIIILLSCLSSCTLETSDNGKLDGMWHLCYVDTLATGNTKNLSDKYYYWSFSFKMLSLRETSTIQEYILSFKRSNDSLHVYEPYKYMQQGEDSLLLTSELLHLYGINNVSESFWVSELSNKRMTLQSSMLRLRFRKL